ncbi:hypothetical protein PanWU01x14_269270 [Parasponia andersonii]|uniref:DUF7950 domain-containing protein n=1 Tax=Parasponia andersonii TaxID=3476 RepID=A0A2P5B5C8_PARAD|nr:hypothetical protein PanWU01x14_269270 [Parasponia andersonii]
MDGGDGWHVASFQSGSHKTIINPIMLRFRPIAPKPAAGGSFPGGISPENTSAVLRTTKRLKRKYVRVRSKNNHNNHHSRRRTSNNNNRSSGEEERESDPNSATVTLQLMPQKSDGYDFLGGGGTRSWSCIINQYSTAVQDNDNSIYNNRQSPADEVTDRTALAVGSVTPQAVAAAVVESWVTVESVPDTCMDVRGLGRTDVERIKNLERDTCPGFVSDGCFSRVEWVNEAYKRMVVAEEAQEEEEEGRRRRPEMLVWLVANNNYYNCQKTELGPMGREFTCRVRVQYMRMNNKERCSKIMPCDVWRMDCGGFAWRLDVKAALSLGL